MATAVVRIVAHILLFALAVVVFYLGLGVGLALNPILGTLLWILAAGLFALNLFWILRRRS